MKLLYPAFFHKEDSGYWVEFPDIEGCFSQGDTVEETMNNAAEALSCHCRSLVEARSNLPKPSDMTDLIQPDDGFITLVKSDASRSDVSVKKTLTLPSWLNDVAMEQHINFSQLLKESLIQRLGLSESQTL